MRRLILVRHAKSSWSDPTLADFERPLNGRGKRDAPAMGERLAGRGLRVDGIIASPALRARKTAEKIAEAIGFPADDIVWERRIYEAGAEELLKVVTRLSPDLETVLLVGHNPGLTELSNRLGMAGLDNLPTCGMLGLEFSSPGWQQITPGEGSVFFYDYPKRKSG